MSTATISKLRSEFPQLTGRKVRGLDLVYLDSAATTLKPKAVIDELVRYYSGDVANVHRGAHWLAENGTAQYEKSRAIVARFIGAAHSSEIVFTRGTTESLNLLASSLGHQLVSGDEVILTEIEHHSNIVPWQLMAEARGAVLKVARVTEGGEIDLAHLLSLVGPRTKVISLSVCSNVLGSIVSREKVASIVKAAKAVGAKVVVDAAQAVTAGSIDVKEWGVDFVVFSGHKLFAPFGIGVLYGPISQLNALPPYQGGGSMIDKVTFEKTTWADVPHKFEAGTPNVGDAIALGRAIDWFTESGSSALMAHAKGLAEQARKQIQSLSGFHVYPASENRTSIVSFNLTGVHASDVGSLLDQQGIAVRTGHHCCQPLMKVLGTDATIRASFSIYNNEEDVERLIAGLKKAQGILL